MATAILVCEICAEEFDSKTHKPLCLECGHTFCFSCISSLMKNSENKHCPKCRKQISKPAKQIPVNYSIIAANSQGCKRKRSPDSKKLCLQHAKVMEYLCMDCMAPMCSKCLTDNHATHKAKLLDDLCQENDHDDSRAKVHAALNNKLQKLNDMALVANGTLKLMNDITNLKTDIEGFNVSVDARIKSTEEDLQAWSNMDSSDENAKNKCREMLCHINSEHEENLKFTDIKKKLDSATKKCNLLVPTTPSHELMPNDTHWTVTDLSSWKRAIASLINERKPSTLTVVSTHTSPIPGLRLLLSSLTEHNLRNIYLMPMDSFWKPAGQTDDEIGTIIKESGDRLKRLYGTPAQILAYSNNETRPPKKLGVRLSSMKDVERCAEVARVGASVRDVCFVRGVPYNTGVYLRGISWMPCQWHFPDLKDSDLDWFFAILSPVYFPLKYLNLVLPRDSLSEAGARRLLMKMAADFTNMAIYCEPHSEIMTSNETAIECWELSTISIIIGYFQEFTT
ncbi:tripartite motif-containing protein 5 [Hyalella azteca]|uniref:Tripartite motif-containing protein 5 n=1 Tax=Hyalella azteca TaxID=294128 RepID=A0A8B7PIT8_HYAAZ|nr:tripartite motif-containing protein 5 [Hyalella azteca]